MLAEILCLEVERVVGRDNTIAHNRRRLQLPASPLRAHYVKSSVKVREYLDGTLAVFHGPRRIARRKINFCILRSCSHVVRFIDRLPYGGIKPDNSCAT
jgi:hypothetical protein